MPESRSPRDASTSDKAPKVAPRSFTALPTSEIVLRPSLVDALQHIASKPRTSKTRYFVVVGLVVATLALAVTPAVRAFVARLFAPRPTVALPNEESVAEALAVTSAAAPSPSAAASIVSVPVVKRPRSGSP